MTGQKATFVLTGLMMLGSVGAFGAGEWGAKELASSSDAAVDALENAVGEDALLSTTSILVKMKAQRNASSVVITYKEEDGTEKKVEFFCHTHGSSIDCH